MADLKIIITSDGSHSLLNTVLGETYHSVHGAIVESRHVFIEAGLRHFINLHKRTSVTILEVGFGTGLNALLTLQEAERDNLKIHYTSLEAFPLNDKVWSTLNYPYLLGNEKTANYFQAIHTATWNEEAPITPNFTLLKKFTTVQHWRSHQQFDLIYFDAFAPAKQPEMWNISVLQKITRSMSPSAIFVTYCAKGQVKRDLKSLGLHVESLPGPPGKLQMTRGTR